MYARVMQITSADPLPYGIAPNRAMIDQLIRYAVDQQILTSPVAAEDLFPDSTHHLTA
jgi:4,5-dihydroxyphthalate decarboxylase